jgi:hypothetical protein
MIKINNMKKVKWIIDKYIFEEYEDKLATAIKNSGSDVYFYDEMKNLTFKEFLDKNFTEKDIVVYHGSLQHGRTISHMPIYPATFMTIDNYECYKYYGYFGDNLLNSEYLMMGLNDVIRNKYFLQYSLIPANQISTIPYDKLKLFIRPSNGYKSFAGQLVSLENLESDINVLSQSYGGIDNDTLVLLSNAQSILEEYRFITIDGEVVSGALYMDEKNMGTHKPYFDKECNDLVAFEFARKMTKIYQPDKAYTIDVCKTSEDEYKLLEINSFNCASMYGCNYDKVVEATNKLAIKEYEELFYI